MGPLRVGVLAAGQVVNGVRVRSLRLAVGLPRLAKRGPDRPGGERQVPAKRLVAPLVEVRGDGKLSA